MSVDLQPGAVEQPRAETVVCRKCGHGNALTRNHCEKCGAHLYVTCKRCGAQNLRTARRCASCRRRLHRPVWRRLRDRYARRFSVVNVGLLLVAMLVLIKVCLWIGNLGEPSSTPPPLPE